MARKTLPPATGEDAAVALRGLALVALIVGAAAAVAMASAFGGDLWFIPASMAVTTIVTALALYVAGTVLRYLGRVVDAAEAQQKATEELLRRLD